MAVRTESVGSDRPGTDTANHPAAGSSGIAGVTRVPVPVHEPNLGYPPVAPARAALKVRRRSMSAERTAIPVVIGGREIRTGRTQQAVMPHNHQHVLADWHSADPEHVHEAIASCRSAAREWASWRWEDRAAIFLRAAELLTTTWRQTLNAATMLGQSKTAFQAEIDS